MHSFTDTYKILIADDHDLVVEGYRSMINSINGFDVVGVAKNGIEVQTFFETKTCDIIILDINMPLMNGVQTIEYLKNKASHLKILVISMLISPLLVNKVVKLGVDGYLFKTSKANNMVKALRQIVQDKKYFEHTIGETKKSGYVSTFNINGQSVDISERELEIIKLISLGKETTEIGELLFISPHTVHTHRKNIYLKLDTHNSVELIVFAMKHSIIASE